MWIIYVPMDSRNGGHRIGRNGSEWWKAIASRIRVTVSFFQGAESQNPILVVGI